MHAKYEGHDFGGSWVYRASKMSLKNHILAPGRPGGGQIQMFSSGTPRGSGGK